MQEDAKKETKTVGSPQGSNEGRKAKEPRTPPAEAEAEPGVPAVGGETTGVWAWIIGLPSKQGPGADLARAEVRGQRTEQACRLFGGRGLESS